MQCALCVTSSLPASPFLPLESILTGYALTYCNVLQSSLYSSNSWLHNKIIYCQMGFQSWTKTCLYTLRDRFEQQGRTAAPSEGLKLPQSSLLVCVSGALWVNSMRIRECVWESWVPRCDKGIPRSTETGKPLTQQLVCKKLTLGWTWLEKECSGILYILPLLRGREREGMAFYRECVRSERWAHPRGWDLWLAVVSLSSQCWICVCLCVKWDYCW